MRFSDPARRHKHMKEAHGYMPTGPRKKYRTTDSYKDVSAQFETMPPWETGPGSSKGAGPSK